MKNIEWNCTKLELKWNLNHSMCLNWIQEFDVQLNLNPIVEFQFNQRQLNNWKIELNSNLVEEKWDEYWWIRYWKFAHEYDVDEYDVEKNPFKRTRIFVWLCTGQWAKQTSVWDCSGSNHEF